MNRPWVLAAGVLGACFVGVAAYSAVSQTIAVGTMELSDEFGGPATITMRTLTIAPGEVLGWHYHPGLGAYTVVITGTLTVEDGCGFESVYTPGQAFREAPLRNHRGKNLTTAPVVTAQTFIEPEGEGTTVRPGGQLCGVPQEVQECKEGGWAAFNFPRFFVSQGDCMQYVVTGK